MADKIGKLIMDKFTEVIVGQATQHSRRKVLAGIGKVYCGKFAKYGCFVLKYKYFMMEYCKPSGSFLVPV